MTSRRAALIALTLALGLVAAPVRFSATVADLPPRLSDQAFWSLVEDFSEPAGFFNSDNLVSNEDTFQYVVPELRGIVKPGGVYLGVGPDQNFTYIAALDPAMSFITDIRRGNLHVHLMYKALFELSASRADFLSRLFSRARPGNVRDDATAAELLRAYADARPDTVLFEANFRAIIEHLTRRHGFRLASGDAEGIDFVYRSFFAGGPRLTFVSNGGGRRTRYPTFEALQTATDRAGVEHGYLASERQFLRVKSHQERNLIVPLVGDFAGARALRAIGSYVRQHGGTVTTVYTSNVEQYLFQDGRWQDFRVNLSSMPFDATSTFIRSCFNTCTEPGGSRAVTLIDSVQGLLADAASGRVGTYWDVLTHSRSSGSAR